MATMGFRYLNGPVIIREYPEDQTAGSFVAGDLVKFSAGEIVLATATDILGVALKSATASGTMIPVLIITAENEFVCEADGTTAATDVGVEQDITFTYGSQCVSMAGTSYYDCVIQQLDPRDGPHTGSGGRVIIRFSPTAVAAHHHVT